MAYQKLMASDDGLNVIVPAPGEGQRIDVLSLFFQSSSGTTVILRSGSSSNMQSAGDMTGPMPFVTGGGLNLPPIIVIDALQPIFQCGENEAFSMYLSGAGEKQVCGGIMYNVATV